MQPNEIDLVQRLVREKKPIPFQVDGATYYLNPDGAAGYHLQHSITKLLRLSHLIHPSSELIFDVGANCGLFSAFAASRLPNATIHAFEPSPSLTPIAALNCGNRRIHFHQVGIGETEGQLTLFVNPHSEQTNSFNRNAVEPFAQNGVLSEVSVNCTTLDDFASKNELRKIDVLKIDVQGGEGAVFRGAKQIMQSVQQIFVESTWLDPDSIAQLIPLGIHYGFKHLAVINPVHMGADILLSKPPIPRSPSTTTFDLTAETAKRSWY